MHTSIAVILGSARKHSDTSKLIHTLLNPEQYTLIDLLDYNIAHYNYEHYYPDTDNFLELINELLNYKVLIFATPVYWYAMSGHMKVFFDRLTDIVTHKKQLGGELKGKLTFLVSVSSEPTVADDFINPFKLTSDYLNMNFISSLHCSSSVLKSNPTLIRQQAASLIDAIEKHAI